MTATILSNNKESSHLNVNSSHPEHSVIRKKAKFLFSKKKDEENVVNQNNYLSHFPRTERLLCVVFFFGAIPLAATFFCHNLSRKVSILKQISRRFGTTPN